MPRTFKREMKNMGMSVWMARTVPVFSAVLKTAEQERGDTGGYISELPKWTHMPGSSFPLRSACSIWFTGSPTFTCEEIGVLLIWVLLTKSHGEKVSFLSPRKESPTLLIMIWFLCSNLMIHCILSYCSCPTLLWLV